MTITSSILLAVAICAMVVLIAAEDANKLIERALRKEKLRKAREAKKRSRQKMRWDVYKNRARELQEEKQIKIVCKNPALAEVFIW